MSRNWPTWPGLCLALIAVEAHAQVFPSLAAQIADENSAYAPQRQRLERMDASATLDVSTANLKELSSNLKRLLVASEAGKDTIDILGSPRSTWPSFKTRAPTKFESLARIYEVTAAIDHDIQTAGIGRFTLLHSESLREIYQLSYDFVLDSDRLKHWGVSKAFARRIGFMAYGAPEIVEGLSRLVGAGRLDDPEGAEMALIGLNKALWGAVGLLVSDGNRAVAGAFANLADYAAEEGREATMPWFTRNYAADHGMDAALIAQYLTAMKVLRAHGKAAVSIEFYYGNDPKILAMLSGRQRAQVDAEFGVALASGGGGDRLTVTTIRTSQHYREVCRAGYCVRQELGGVSIDPKPRARGQAPANLAPSITAKCGQSTTAACRLN